jgi:phosphate transport system permease protein
VRSGRGRTYKGGVRADTVLGPALFALAATSAALLALVLLFLARESWPALTDGGWRRFFASDGWYPASGDVDLWPMAWATLAASTGALAIALPLGVGGAIFARFYAPAGLGTLFRRLLALLAGIPSVVFGLWGLTVLVPLIARWQPPGASLFAAVLILALMVLPTVALTAEAALAAVPPAWLAGAHALGLTRSATVLRVALPAARAGITGGALLAAARALGETMAVLMVAGNVVQTPTGLFEPVRVLTANIALEMAYATGTHRAALFVSGLLLTALVALLAWGAARMGARGDA